MRHGLLVDARSDYGRLFDGNPQPMWIFDLETLGFVDVNDAALERYGYARDEFRSLTLRDIRPPEDVPRLLAHLPSTRDAWTAGTSLWCHKKKDGSLIDVEITSFRLQFAGRPSRVVIANEVTAKKRAEAQVRELLNALVHAERAERERIARELHDETAQSLVSLLLGLRRVVDAPSLDDAQTTALELRDRVSSVLEEVRRIAHGLRPAALVESGLSLALQRLGAELAELHGMRIDVAVGDPHLQLPLPIEIALYRVAQEALSNVVKHASARTVSVVLRRTRGEVVLIVEDDGRGFRHPSAGSDRQLGLAGIRERAALLGGRLTVESEPGVGTTLYVALPLGDPT